MSEAKREGNLRNSTDWLDNDPDYELIADRGYTGHEHLTEFGLINMNGRVYDPVIGRFLSPDPFVQAPGQVDGYNRYAYVMNNPLRYVDPTGYEFSSDQNREYTWGLWGIKPQRDSGGHGKTGGGTTMGSSISSAGGGMGQGSGMENYGSTPNAIYTYLDMFSVGYYYKNPNTIVVEERIKSFQNIKLEEIFQNIDITCLFQYYDELSELCSMSEPSGLYLNWYLYNSDKILVRYFEQIRGVKGIIMLTDYDINENELVVGAREFIMSNKSNKKEYNRGFAFAYTYW